MILESLVIPRAEFEKRTGWELKDGIACKADLCVPLGIEIGETIDARVIAERLHLPLVHDDASNLFALGPEGGRRAITDVRAPALELDDWRGNIFHLASLRGKKVLLIAWASW